MSPLSTIAVVCSAFAIAVNSMPTTSIKFSVRYITKDTTYFVVNDPGDFDFAANYCEQKEAKLAVVDTEEKAATVYKIVKDDYGASESSSFYWIGAQARPNSTCGADNFSWLDTEKCLKDTFTNWCDGDPNKKNKKDENCVHVENRNNTYCWAKSDCHQKNLFVCERGTSDQSRKRALDRFNLGYNVQADIVFGKNTRVPRFASVNATVLGFGKAVNFLEVGATIEGLERPLE